MSRVCLVFSTRDQRHELLWLLAGGLSFLGAIAGVQDVASSDSRVATRKQAPAATASARTATPPDALRARVRPIPPAVFVPKPANEASKTFAEAYYDSVVLWGGIVLRQLRPVPNHPEWRYLGLPRNVEDDVRPTAYSAMVLGFLAEYQPPLSSVDPANRDRWRKEAIGLLKYLTTSHVSGGGACVNGKPWGDAWQSAMWARAVGMVGWFLWNDLDADLQSAVAQLVEHEADRFVKQPPRSGLCNNTAAEENAWNALVTSLACNMMPTHPRAKAWEEASIRYMYNSFSVAADASDDTPGDWERPIKDWVATVNAHEDFTVENHGLVHVGYLKNTASELQECILPWLITGREVPAACMHRIPEVFDLMMSCMAWDAGPLYFAGTDWKIYHEQTCEIVIYAMLNLLKADRRAAALERTAIEWVGRQQRAQKGFYNVRRDLEYGGLCATRLIACCLAHGIVDSPAEPISAEEIDRLASGTRHLVAGKAVIHRTPSKLVSFAWAQKRMAVAVPRDGTWVVWPHFASYLGMIDDQDSSSRNAELKSIHVDVKPDQFRASGTLLRCKGRLAQDFFFASPPGDCTVYIERLESKDGLRPVSRQTGIIGLEYPVDSNHRVLHGPWGAMKTTGYGGRPEVHTLAGDWLNIDDRVGYVILRSDGLANRIRYHDESQGVGRVPQLQEWISLIGEKESASPTTPSWACVVTFLNQTAEDTARRAGQVRFQTRGDTAICNIGKDAFEVTFGANRTDRRRDRDEE